MKKHFLVTVEIPNGVSVRDMQNYIRDAIQMWKGQEHPDDPIFNLDWDTVKVRPIKGMRHRPDGNREG